MNSVQSLPRVGFGGPAGNMAGGSPRPGKFVSAAPANQAREGGSLLGGLLLLGVLAVLGAVWWTRSTEEGRPTGLLRDLRAGWTQWQREARRNAIKQAPQRWIDEQYAGIVRNLIAGDSPPPA